MQMPYTTSRNFSSLDFARRDEDRLATDPTQIYLTAYMHGYLQAIRDALSKRFSGFKGLVVTSANRRMYNSSVKGAAPNSHHIYRLEGNMMHCAVDVKPLGISLSQLYNYCKQNCRGEIYLNLLEGIVHIAPVQMEDQAWIKSE